MSKVSISSQSMHTMIDSVRDIDQGLRGCLKLGSIYSTISPWIF